MRGRYSVTAFVVAAALLALAPTVMGGYWLGILTQGLIFALLAASLDLLAGYTGMSSLGHGAFFGVGSYGLAIAMTKYGWGPGVSAVAGVLAAAGFGLLFGLVAVRARGIYFLVITLAFGQVLWGVAVKWTDFTGGYNGIAGVTRPEVFGLSLSSAERFYYAVFVVVALGLMLLHRLVSSPVGLTLQGIRSGELRMGFLGYRTAVYRWAVFTLAAGFAGLAGVLNGYYLRFAGPDNLFWVLSAQVLLMVIIGSAGTLWGPALAGIVLIAAQTAISNESDRWITVLGLLYIFTVLLAPGGIFRLAVLGMQRAAGSIGARRTATS